MICTKCQTENIETAKFCNSCGNDLSEPAVSVDTPEEVASDSSVVKKKSSARVFWGLLVAVIVFVIVVVNSANAGKKTSTQPEVSDAPAVASDAWVPKGLSVYVDDSDVAWAFDNKTNCGVLGDNGCIHVKISTHRECSSLLYVEANEIDSAGNVIGMTNATLGHLRVGQITSLELDALDAETASFQLSKITCV